MNRMWKKIKYYWIPQFTLLAAILYAARKWIMAKLTDILIPSSNEIFFESDNALIKKIDTEKLVIVRK